MQKTRRRGKRCKKKRKRKYTLEEKQAYANRLRMQQTPAEKKMATILRGIDGCENFEAQQVVCGYIPDFVDNTLMIIIEVDGPVHRYHRARDKRREIHLVNAGYRVIRFSNHSVIFNSEYVREKLVDLIRKISQSMSFASAIL